MCVCKVESHLLAGLPASQYGTRIPIDGRLLRCGHVLGIFSYFVAGVHVPVESREVDAGYIEPDVVTYQEKAG